MSDPRFSALLEETEAATRPPEFAAVERLAARRRSRGRYAVAGTAVGTVAALAVGFGLFQGGSAPSPTTSPTAPSRGGPEPYAQFVDLEHGYVTYPGGAPDKDCRVTFRVTGDGGETWSEPRRTPAVERQEGGCDPLPVFVDGDTVIAPNAGSPRSTERFISHDAGRTWQPYRPKTKTVDAVPDGIVPHQICLTAKECNQESFDHLGWYDPATGDRMVLKSVPDLENLGTPVLASDGSIWTMGCDYDGKLPGKCGVAVSRDQGRSWRTTRFDDLPSELVNLMVYDGETSYLTVHHSADPMETGVWTTFRSDDGGASWQQVAEIGLPLQESLTSWLAADGTLVVGGFDARGTAWYASSDGGRTYQKTSMPKGLGSVIRIPGGFGSQGTSSDAPWVTYLSEDGLTWREVTLPPRD